MKLGIEELSIIVEGLRLRVKQLSSSVTEINQSIENLENEDGSKAPAIMQTTSPAGIVSFSDGAEDMPIKSLKCTIIPVQAGTGDPAPDNIRPITGRDGVTVIRCGNNFFGNASKTVNYYGCTAVFDGSNIKLTGTATSAGGRGTIKTDNFHLEAGTYYLKKFNESGTSPVVVAQNGTSALTSPFTLTEASDNISIGISLTANTTYDYSADIMLSPIDAASFEPYQGVSKSISFPQTVYGGWIDVIKGELHVTKAAVDLGGMTWTKGTDSTGIYFYTTISNAKTQPSYVAPANIMCSQYVTCLASNVVDKGIAISVASPICFVRDTTYSDAAVFKEAMSGVQLVYELATEQVLPVEPVTITTLLGNNNVFCNTGNVEVEYAADTKIYIDNAIAAVTPEPEPTPEPEQDEAPPEEEEEEAGPALEEEIAEPEPEELEEVEEAAEEPEPVVKRTTRKK